MALQAAGCTFSHPEVDRILGPLTVYVNPNSIQWSYGMNVATYPTYGGEVVQILSCFVDDMQIEGEVGTYAEVERIYTWFIQYFQVATQGKSSAGDASRFNTIPVTFNYPARGWTFTVYPKNLVRFKYGRDVVVPTWSVECAVSENDERFKEALIDSKLQEMMESDGVEFFGTTTANIGFKEDNPFSGMLEPGTEESNKLADAFNNLIPAWMGGDFSDLSASYSKPAALAYKGNSAAVDRQTGTRDAVKEAKGIKNRNRNRRP